MDVHAPVLRACSIERHITLQYTEGAAGGEGKKKRKKGGFDIPPFFFLFFPPSPRGLFPRVALIKGGG